MVEEERRKHYYRDGFQYVAQKSQRAGFFAVCTQHVCAAGVAAAGSANIPVIQLI